VPRVVKRASILEAAAQVFAERGYAATAIDDVAAAAEVAKATVYSHFGDKEGLFRAMLGVEAERAAEDNLAAVERLLDVGDDLPAALRDVGRHLVDCYCDPRNRALIRLVNAELPRHPDLVELLFGRTQRRVHQALADRLLALSVAGRLHINDPSIAAEHLGSLLTGAIDGRTQFGIHPLKDADRDHIVACGIEAFLGAYGVRPAG
jgi:TetR/AcrR family transcriptional repressor of mexJK operon